MIPTAVCQGGSDTITGSICVMDGNSIFLSNFWDSILCLDPGYWSVATRAWSRYKIFCRRCTLGLSAWGGRLEDHDTDYSIIC